MMELTLKEELRTMEVRLTEMEEKIDDIGVKLSQVVDALLGNPLTKVGGFIAEFEELKKRIDFLQKKQQEYEDFKKRIYWTVALISAGVILLQYITSVYANLHK